MRASVACRIRKDKQTESGEAAVYLQILLNSKRLTIPLGVSWPVNKFDNQAGVFKERFKSDQEANDYNMLVNKEKAKVNDILMYYRHSDVEITLDKFKTDYKGYDTRHDFITWFQKEIAYRFQIKNISVNTKKSDLTVFKTLQDFRHSISFSELNQNLLEEFEGYCRSKGLALNSVYRYTKRARSYMLRASLKGYKIDIKSIKNYELLNPTSKLIYLKEIEIVKLEKYFDSSLIPEHQKRVLRYFLFSCYTGLRISDVVNLTWKNVAEDILTFQMKKGSTKQVKTVEIPLIEKAFNLIITRKGNLFDVISDQKSNKHLKEIMVCCGIRKHVTNHTARHTFATQFLRRGGHLEVLQKLLGHDNIQSTMVYIHVDTDRLRSQMELME